MPDQTGQPNSTENQAVPTVPSQTATQEPPAAKPLPLDQFGDFEAMLNAPIDDDPSAGSVSDSPYAPSPDAPPAQETPPATTPEPTSPTETKATDAGTQPEQTTDQATTGEGGKPSEPVSEIQALLSHLKGETTPEEPKKPETPDLELPWHKRLSDDELGKLQGQIHVNEDGSVDVPQITINKSGESSVHVKHYDNVNSALMELAKAPLTTRRALYDAEHAQAELERLQSQAAEPVEPPAKPGSVEDGTTTPFIPDLQPFGGKQQTETQTGTQETPSIGTPSALGLNDKLYQEAYNETLKSIEPRMYDQLVEERIAELREEKGLDETDPPPRLSSIEKANLKKLAREQVKEQAAESEGFKQAVYQKMTQRQAEINAWWQHEEAQAEATLGPHAKDLLQPILSYRNRVERLGQAPAGQDEALLHRAMTGMNGMPNVTLLATMAMNHMAMLRALPDIKAVARKEGEKAVLSKIEEFGNLRLANRNAVARPGNNQQMAAVETRTGGPTAPPGFSDQTVPTDGFIADLDRMAAEPPAWMSLK